MGEAPRPHVRLSHGGAMPIEQRSGGFIDTIDVRDSVLSVRGWSGGTAPVRRTTAVLAFSAGRLVAAQGPILPRPDVADAHGPTLANSGFALRLPGRARPTLRGLRLFAVVGGRALPLGYTPEAARARRAFVGSS